MLIFISSAYRKGYVPGESIIFSAEVDNKSNKVNVKPTV